MLHYSSTSNDYMNVDSDLKGYAIDNNGRLLMVMMKMMMVIH